MAIQKPSIPTGTRDFGSVEMSKRNFIFNIISKVFRNHGYVEISTPAFENLDTLMGKYGEEGDRLIFKILESGEYFEDIKSSIISNKERLYIYEFLVEVYKNALRSILATDYFNITKAEIKSKVSNALNNINYEQLKLNYEKVASLRNYFIHSVEGISKRFEIYLDNYFDQIEYNERNLEFFIQKYLKKHILGVSSFLANTYIPQYVIENFNSRKATSLISKKALRYDLTVPFARYVVQHQNEIEFPFKRYQIQPVWRADRPQKGRYREFYQCDADVIGSNSLINEADLVKIIDEVFGNLNIRVKIKINNRKILTGIAEYIGQPEKITDITVAIDKLEKIGIEAVSQELQHRGVTVQALYKLEPFFAISGGNEEKLKQLRSILKSSEQGIKGIDESEQLLDMFKAFGIKSEIEFDISLARGLNYYTGTIIEVKAFDVEMGSICGGGRYDDLTGIFGLKDISGVGISFGADRIYDVMEHLNLFPGETVQSSKVLFVNFGEKESMYCISVLQELHKKGIAAELYPDAAKLKKQMGYADARHIQYVVLIGENEMNEGILTVKNMVTGEQFKSSVKELMEKLI